MKEIRIPAALIYFALLLTPQKAVYPAPMPTGKDYTNSIGMKFVRIEPGQFLMGQETGGDFDERPTHRVNITKPFYMAVTEVTNAQYERFDPQHRALRGKYGVSNEDDESVIFVSYNDAVSFCRWLSKTQTVPSRLPTEAEWEYACRAGTKTLFNTGDILPPKYHRHQKEKNKDGDVVTVSLHAASSPANKWDLRGMHGGVEEWCHDWYGPYLEKDQTDPVGRIAGLFRVTRGGSHNTEIRYLRSANRMAMLPEDKSCMIGFRVVIGPLPQTRPLPAVEPPLCMRDVNQGKCDWSNASLAHPAGRPFFDGPKRFLKIAPNSAGPLFSDHNHCPAVTFCPNGDLLAVWFSCDRESGREMSIAAARLRRGNNQWDNASEFFNVPDRNMTGSALLNDAEGRIWYFNGVSADAVYRKNLALIMRTSDDNGATWSKPRLINPQRGISSQPIAGAFRTRNGQIVLASDWPWSRKGGGSALWISPDLGQTWRISKAPIAGIHAGLVELNDSRLLAFGRLLRGRRPVPQSISPDMGRTWNYSDSQFPPIGGGQRLVLIRLREGPILFVSFANKNTPITVTNSAGEKFNGFGLFAALSLDEGKTWSSFRLVKSADRTSRKGQTMDGREYLIDSNHAEPKGYLACTQTPDGVVHLITSWNHYQFNLNWLRTPPEK